MDDLDLVDALSGTWSATSGDLHGMSAAAWDTPTACGAGWQRDMEPPIVSGDAAAVDRVLGLLPVTP